MPPRRKLQARGDMLIRAVVMDNVRGVVNDEPGSQGHHREREHQTQAEPADRRGNHQTQGEQGQTHRIGPRKEKSLPEKNTAAVSPANTPSVRIPA